MQLPAALFEFYRPGEACAQSQHGGEDDDGSMFLEPRAFLQPLAVLRHVYFPLLDTAGYPRHQLPVNHHLLLGSHEHLPELLQPALHLPDDALALLHFQETPASRLELHAGAGSDEFGRGRRGGGRRGVGTGQQSIRHSAEVSHRNGAPGGRRGHCEDGGGRR